MTSPLRRQLVVAHEHSYLCVSSRAGRKWSKTSTYIEGARATLWVFVSHRFRTNFPQRVPRADMYEE